MKKVLVTGMFLLLATASLTAADGPQCFTAAKFQSPLDKERWVVQAVEYLETQKDHEEAQKQATEQWATRHIPHFDPGAWGIKFNDHGTHTTATITWPGGRAEIFLYGPFRPLPEDLPHYVAAGQMIFEPPVVP